MKEKLYTIPVNDAFAVDCECPLCTMKRTLETDSIEYTLGPSYMEDDIREVTDKKGFCKKHIGLLYKNQNRLGLALMLKTHLDKTINDATKATNDAFKVKSSLFKKTVEESPVADYFSALNSSCFICDRINNVFERYIITVLHLYKTDSEFRATFKNCKGFCNEHFEALHSKALTELPKDILDEFLKDLNTLYIENLKRVRDDLDWFICKFDYRYANEPWKNSKDSLVRAILKTNSEFIE